MNTNTIFKKVRVIKDAKGKFVFRKVVNSLTIDQFNIVSPIA